MQMENNMQTTSLHNEYAPRKILVVEDNVDDIVIISRFIKRIWETSKVLSANTLQEAFDLCQQHHFDLVLLDLNLPDSHGTHTVRDFRKFNMGARIVAVTGMDVDHIDIDVKSFGASAIISKSRLLSEDFADHLLESAFNIPPLSLAPRHS